MDDLNKPIEKEIITMQTETFTPGQLKDQYATIKSQKDQIATQFDEQLVLIADKYNALKGPPDNLELPPIEE